MVIGADSAATLTTSLGEHTVRQPVSKVEIIDNRLLLAVSGPVGLAQRLEGLVSEAWSKNDPKNRISGQSWEVMTKLRELFKPHLLAEIEASATAQRLIGTAALQSAVSHTVLAMVCKNQPCLFQFNLLGAPEEATANLPFVCVGSMQVQADLFMAFLSKVFWEKGKTPTLPQGEFATVWTLDLAISVAPAFVAGPYRIFRLAKEGSDWRARELDETELGEHQQAIGEATKALRNYREGFQHDDEEVTPPPSPS